MLILAGWWRNEHWIWSALLLLGKAMSDNIKTILVLSSYSSGSTAVTGFLEQCGAYACPPFTVTNDPLTPSPKEPLEYRNTLVSCIDEFSLRKKKPNSVFLDFFIKWHPVQSAKAAEAGSKAIVLKHPLQAFFLDEIFRVCDPKLVVVHRPFDNIEATRLRRKWHPVYGRAGARIIYNSLYSKLHETSKSYISIPYESFLGNFAIQDDLLSFCSLNPTPSELAEARKFLRAK
jgi:hypothetical protein